MLCMKELFSILAALLQQLDCKMRTFLLAKEQKQKTYNSWDSLVVTHPATNQPACGLSLVNSLLGAFWVS